MRAEPYPIEVSDAPSLRERLEDNAFLFDEPDAYRAGVRDTLRAVARRLSGADAPSRSSRPAQQQEPPGRD